jgi:hypothetical protein
MLRDGYKEFIMGIIHFNYTAPSEATYDNKMSFSALNATIELGTEQKNCLAISNETKLTALSLGVNLSAGMSIGYAPEFDKYAGSGLKSPFNKFMTAITTAKGINFQKPQIADLDAAQNHGVEANIVTNYVNDNAVICSYGRSLSIENTKPALDRANVMTALGALNMLLSTAVVGYAFATSVVQNVRISDMNKDYSAADSSKDEDSKSKTEQTQTLKIEVPQTMYFFVSGSSAPACRVSSISFSDTKVTVYKISKGANATDNDSFKYAEDVSYAVLSTKLSLSVDYNGTSYSSETEITEDLTVDDEKFDFTDLTYTWCKKTLALKSSSGATLSGYLPYLIICNDNSTLKLLQYSDSLNQHISEILGENAKSKKFSNIKFELATEDTSTTTPSEYTLKLDSSTLASLSLDTFNSKTVSGSLQLPGFKSYTLDDRSFVIRQGGMTGDKDSDVILKEIDKGSKDSVDTSNTDETFIPLYGEDNKSLAVYQDGGEDTDYQKLAFENGVIHSSSEGMKYNVGATVKVNLSYSSNNKKFTLNVIMVETEDGDTFQTATSKKSISSKNGHMTVSRTVVKTEPSVNSSSEKLEDLLNKTFVLYANNATSQVSAFEPLEYIYFFFRVFYDETHDQFIIKELPIVNYASFYNALSAYKQDNSASDDELKANSSIPLTAALGVAAAAPVALLAALGLTEIIQNCTSSGINYTAQKRSIIFQIISAKDKKMKIAPGATGTKNIIELTGPQNDGSEVSMISDKITLSSAEGSKPSIEITGNKTTIKCKKSTMVIKKDDIEMSVKNTKFKLSSNGGISISFNGMENTTITKDTATFKDSVGNSHQFNA